MTYPPHWLLSYGGQLYAEESWANNIRFIPPFGATFGAIENIEGALADLVADVSAHVAHTDSGYTTATYLDWVKFNEIDAEGRYADPTESHTVFLDSTSRVRGTATAVMPAQVALVVSFGTGRSRGLASKGRCFVPAPSAGFNGGDGLLQETRRQAIAAQWAAFMSNLRNWPGLDYPNAPVPGIVSKVGTPGPAEEITDVRIGSVLDTQRRRRAQMTESYVTAAVA